MQVNNLTGSRQTRGGATTTGGSDFRGGGRALENKIKEPGGRKKKKEREMEREKESRRALMTQGWTTPGGTEEGETKKTTRDG